MRGEGAEADTQAATWRQKASVAACLITLGSLFFGGCGFEEYVVLEPPYNSSSSLTAIFSHDLANDQNDFLGYNVVYRIYETSDKATAAAGAIEASWSSLTPDSIIKNRLSKFKPVALIDSLRDALMDFPPSIKIPDKSVKTDVSLLFTNDGTGKLTDQNSVVLDFTVKRNTNDGMLTFGDFAPSDDCDYVEEPNTAFVLVYAYAYGFSLGSTGPNEFYSQPVRLLLAELSAYP